jgi:hypothetical protein
MRSCPFGRIAARRESMYTMMEDWEQRTSMRLRAHLQAQVPSRIRYYLGKDGPSEEDLERVRSYATDLGTYGDLILFPNGNDKPYLEKLVDALAVLAFCPGGVTVFGLHFDATKMPEESQDELQALLSYFDGLFDTTWRKRYSREEER